jgi:hypothetical protein
MGANITLTEILTWFDLSVKSGAKTQSSIPEMRKPSKVMDRRMEAAQHSSTGTNVANSSDENI